MNEIVEVALPGEPCAWVVESLDAPDGNPLPVLRHAASWSPAPLALAYALEMRRRLAPGSLRAEMAHVALLYAWADRRVEIGFLEDYLRAGLLLERDQLGALRDFLRRVDPLAVAGHVGEPPAPGSETLASEQTINKRLNAAKHFLSWAVDPLNHGGTGVLTDEQIETWTGHLERRIRKWREVETTSERHEPLTPEAVRWCRRAIGPDRFGRFRPAVFEERTRFRNYALFEFFLNYGARASEAALARVGHLPDLADPADRRLTIAFPKQHHVADAKGHRRQRVKTPRLVRVPPLDPEAFRIVRAYVAEAAPRGRRESGVDAATDRLFVRRVRIRQHGVSADATGVTWKGLSYPRVWQIVAQIGEYAWAIAREQKGVPASRLRQLEADLTDLKPHRLRHTWAEQTAYALYKKHGEEGFHRLQVWGGWSSPAAMAHYTQYARERADDEQAESYFNSFSLKTTHAA